MACHATASMSWEPELEELRRREALARAMGGEERVARQHAAGKPTVRERIERLLDEGSFHETGTLAGVARYGDDGGLETSCPPTLGPVRRPGRRARGRLALLGHRARQRPAVRGRAARGGRGDGRVPGQGDARRVEGPDAGGGGRQRGARHGRSFICALGRLEGRPVGVLAGDPKHSGGGLTGDASDKLVRFVDLCDQLRLPVANFVDQPGFVIG
jgi:acetyl-CoA carboxylase carboxyltransferase component